MHFIKYKEHEYPIQIDFSVIKAVCSRLGIRLLDFEQVVNDPSQCEVVAYESLKRGHKLDGKEFKLSQEDAEEMLSESFADFLQIFTLCVLKIFTPSDKSKKN
jgi:hypothetical protein